MSMAQSVTMFLFSMTCCFMGLTFAKSGEPFLGNDRTKVSFLDSPDGSIQSMKDDVSFLVSNYVVEGKPLGLMLARIKPRGERHHMAYVLLVNHKLVKLRESPRFPIRFMHDGQTLRVKHGVRDGKRKLLIRYTFEGKQEPGKMESFQIGKTHSDLQKGRLFLIGFVSNPLNVQQVSLDWSEIEKTLPIGENDIVTNAHMRAFLQKLILKKDIDAIDAFVRNSNVQVE